MYNNIELAELAVKAARDAGADFADVSVGESRSLSVEFEDSNLHSVAEHTNASISVRAIINGATGTMQTSGLNTDSATETAKRAVDAARLAEPDPDFVRLPEAEEFTEVKGLYDEDVANITPDELIQMVEREVKDAVDVNKNFRVQASGRRRTGQNCFANSSGVLYEHAGSSISASVSPTLREGDEVGSFYDFGQARRKSEFVIEGIGRTAAEQAAKFMGAEKGESGSVTLVLGPLSSMSLFGSLASAASGESIQRGRSFLTNKLGEKIGNDNLTIIDDGLIEGGMSSGALDGDGSVRKRVSIIEKGVFTSELHSLYTSLKAKKLGREVEVTGHGTRGGVSPSNVIPTLGDKTASQLISEVSNGIYLNIGSFSPNPITGDISCSIDFGFRIKDGELVAPLKNTMLAANIFDVLKNIDGISSDARRLPGSVLPTVRVSDVQMTSDKSE